MSHLIVVTEATLRRLERNWPPEELARRVEAHFPTARGLDAKAIGKWERRFQTPRHDYAQALCHELDAPALDLLGIGRSLAAQAYWRLATPDERDTAVRRRKLLEDSLALAGGVVLLPVDRLAKWANWYGQARRVDPALPGELEALSTQIARAYTAGQTASALPAARAQAHSVTRLLDRAVMTSAQRNRLRSIGADAAAMQGVLELNIGNPGEARDAFDLALDLARDARDARLEALVTAAETWLWSPAQLGARATKSPQQAVDALEHACVLGRHAPAPAQAWLHAYHAWHLAAAGDAGQWARALASVQDTVGGIHPDEHGWGFFSTHGELAGLNSGRILGFEGDTRLLLGQHADAINPLQQALGTAYMSMKEPILRRSLMAAWTGADEPEPACAAGIACLGQADAASLTLNVELVRDIRATFPGSWADLDCVHQLDDRLRAHA